MDIEDYAELSRLNIDNQKKIQELEDRIQVTTKVLRDNTETIELLRQMSIKYENLLELIVRKLEGVRSGAFAYSHFEFPVGYAVYKLENDVFTLIGRRGTGTYNLPSSIKMEDDHDPIVLALDYTNDHPLIIANVRNVARYWYLKNENNKEWVLALYLRESDLSGMDDQDILYIEYLINHLSIMCLMLTKWEEGNTND